MTVGRGGVGSTRGRLVVREELLVREGLVVREELLVREGLILFCSSSFGEGVGVGIGAGTEGTEGTGKLGVGGPSRISLGVKRLPTPNPSSFSRGLV